MNMKLRGAVVIRKVANKAYTVNSNPRRVRRFRWVKFTVRIAFRIMPPRPLASGEVCLRVDDLQAMDAYRGITDFNRQYGQGAELFVADQPASSRPKWLPSCNGDVYFPFGINEQACVI
jgi:hypothetical protein